MIHLPNSNDVGELRRVLTLIQELKYQAPVGTTAPIAQPGIAQGSLSLGGQSSGGSGGGGGIAGATGPQGPQGAKGDVSNLLIGQMEMPEILLGASGDVLTDSSGFSLLGVHVESVVLTGAGDTIQAMGV